MKLVENMVACLCSHLAMLRQTQRALSFVRFFPVWGKQFVGQNNHGVLFSTVKLEETSFPNNIERIDPETDDQLDTSQSQPATKSLTESNVMTRTKTDEDVGEYAMRTLKMLEREGKLKNRRRGVWLIRRHIELVEKFCQTPKQVLGLSLIEYKKRVELLQELGISHEDALVIGTSFPSCLNFDAVTISQMVSLLKKFGCYLPKHFMRNPYVFYLDPEHCRSSLEKLQKIGLSLENIGSLIDTNPLVLTVPLSSGVEEFATNARNYQASNNILRLALKSSLVKSGAQVSQNEDLKDIVEFLHELKVDLSKLMQKCPEFFCTNYKQLVETYQFLSGAPLYCEKKHVKKLLTSNPHAFLQMNKATFQQSVTSLSGIVDSDVKLYLLLQKSPMLFVDSTQVLLERIELLKKYQFSQKEIISLLEKAAFVFSDEKSSDNLEKKLYLILSKKDITTSQVCNSAFVLRAPLEKIQKRLFFIRSQTPEVLEKFSLSDVVFSTNQRFITEMCCSSPKVFLETVELADTSL